MPYSVSQLYYDTFHDIHTYLFPDILGNTTVTLPYVTYLLPLHSMSTRTHARHARA